MRAARQDCTGFLVADSVKKHWRHEGSPYACGPPVERVVESMHIHVGLHDPRGVHAPVLGMMPPKGDGGIPTSITTQNTD